MELKPAAITDIGRCIFYVDDYHSDDDLNLFYLSTLSKYGCYSCLGVF